MDNLGSRFNVVGFSCVGTARDTSPWEVAVKVGKKFLNQLRREIVCLYRRRL